MARKDLKINYPAARRWEHFKRVNETQTEALQRLLDEAGVPDPRQCKRCNSTAFEDVWTPEGNRRCEHCADVPGDEIPPGGLRE